MKGLTGMLMAPAAWFLDLQTSYASVKWVCEHDLHVLQLLLPLGSLTLVAIGAALSWQSFVEMRGRATEDGALLQDRNYFMEIGGLSISAIFALLILTSYFGRVLLSPCE